MNADLRASLLVGAVAAGLSMLVGLIARVLFVPLFLRAVFFGALFGGLTWGVATLLRTYVPDLFDGAGRDGEGARPEDGAADERLGSAVDIVLDGSDDEVLAVADLGGESFVPDGMREGGGGDIAEAAAETVADVAPVADLAGNRLLLHHRDNNRSLLSS